MRNVAPTLRAAILVGMVALVRVSHAPGAEAQERLSHTFGPDHGLAAPPVWAIAQDSVGFLWIGAEGGLFRLDGVELQRWAPDAVPGAVADLAVSPSGEVAAVEFQGRVHRITPTGVRTLPWPGSPPPALGWTLAFDGQGILWRIADEGVWWLAPDDTWTLLPPHLLQDEAARTVFPGPSGGVDIVTEGGVWRIEGASTRDGGASRTLWSGPPPRRLLEASRVTTLAAPEPGRLLALHDTEEGEEWQVVEVADGERRVRIHSRQVPSARPIALVERAGTLWLAMDRYLVAVDRGGGIEVLGLEDGIDSGGPLMVDREGSLWLGSFVGLQQFPEPDTRIWTERHHLASRHARFLARTGDAIWAMTWSGPSYIREHGTPTPARWSVGRPGWDSRSRICADGRGAAWVAGGPPLQLRVLRDTTSVPWMPVEAGPAVEGTAANEGTGTVPSTVGPPPTVEPPPTLAPGSLRGCVPAAGGGVWVGTATDLRYVDPESGRSRLVPVPATEEPEAVVAALHDRADRVWIGMGDQICRAPAAAVLAGAGEAWSCDTLSGLDFVTGMVEMPTGAIWASSNALGVVAWDGDTWRPLPMEGLPSRNVFALVPSPRGGVWVVGSGILERVVEGGAWTVAPEGTYAGWEVLERLTRWHGLPAVGGSSLVEEPDGTVWLASSRGVIRVPARARFDSPPGPPVALVEAGVDGETVPVDGTLVLPHDRNRLEARFAALSFRDPSRLLHQVRLGPDDPWSESRGQPEFRWVDLQPGSYRAEYRASLDGATWSPEPVQFAFRVRAPWYRTPWFLALTGVLGVAMAWTAYRARVAYLLGLERQRTDIAMDLHDEVGSGLASVGILSGLLAAGQLDDDERRSTAREIATVAEELGHALSDIVWSLDPRTATMEELATRLAEHGERLCAGDRITFTARFPESWPPGRPDVAVRRNVLRIGLEALHNAVRHAEARTVTLVVQPLRAGIWRLQVRDDGKGTAAPAGSAAGEARLPEGRAGGGHGLRWMRRRANEIGARFELQSQPGQGTVITLYFRLQGGGRV